MTPIRFKTGRSTHPPQPEDIGDPPDIIREWAERVIGSWHLSDEQRDILLLVIKGLTEQEIADMRGISRNRVINHKEQIRKKAGLDSFREVFGELLRL